MNLDKSRFVELIKTFKIKELFNELGWDSASINIPIKIDEDTFNLFAVAEKRGFLIFVCSPDSNGKIPTKDIRKRIDIRITKLYYEHLIIYTDKNISHQIWQLVIREPNKPFIVRETDYFSSQHPELLFQKLRGLFFSLDDEDKISIADVRSNVREQFNTNAERVTKRFYDEFKKHHTAFLKFIKGIEEQVNKEWYASLMLNRLMFIYFIQKKGFLDNNPNYLHDKLNEVQKRKGRDKFYSFYRNFLLVLFHKGLGSLERSNELIKEIGNVPYLNGGLFDVHQLEKENHNIEIPDEAFQKIFNFFDEYNWHLDTKITASGKDINPDVIGYIFEKYINDRAEMGAYYTKEDITEYISKNTIIPFLFDRVKEEVANAFKDDSTLWKMLKENPDRYIYDAVKHGVKLTEEEFKSVISLEDSSHPLWKDLPDEIKAGFRPDIKDKIVVADEKPHLWEIRKPWTKPAPPEIALPTEIYRELIERRKRYFEIRKKLVNGEIKEINDFITYNLNIRQFAQDAVEQYEGSDFINAFYKAITKITVLDPTCGSGAFLFAALNILEPLYYACIQRMKAFVESDTTGKKYTNFRKVLDEINKHPNEQYYIYKSIILNNLYGVDIMKEAVEIAKLRLFLKLVAEVEDFDHLEPLPDIDFNVRAGNTLIGYANKKEIDELEGLFVTPKMKEKIFEECELVSKAFKRFKEIQVEGYDNKKEFTEAKKELNERLNKLKTELDKILYKQHYESTGYDNWLETHKPFHWFAEFYEIINSGGFDVIIGNPPYVVYTRKIGKNKVSVADRYKLKNYKTLSTNNLYSYCIERSYLLHNKFGKFGMVLPFGATSTPNMIDLVKLVRENKGLWISNYDERPSHLFSGVCLQITILLSSTNSTENNVTKLIHWNTEQRNYLFNYFFYENIEEKYFINLPLKLNYNIEKLILGKISKINKISNYFRKSTPHKAYYKSAGGRYFKIFTDFIPEFSSSDETVSTAKKEISFSTKTEKELAIGAFSSSLFYWFWRISSDCRNLTAKELNNFPLDLKLISELNVDKLLVETKELMRGLKSNSIEKEAKYESSGSLTYQEFRPKITKHILDNIDTVLAEHYGFTEEELDFIINYDIKYRMGKENNED